MKPLAVVALLLPAAALGQHRKIEWRDLPELPRGVAGAHAGVLAGRLIVAGGSWWTAPPWSGGDKRFESNILALSRNAKSYRRVGELPQALAYGATVEIPGGMAILGGQTPDGFSSRTWIVRQRGGRVEAVSGPSLPHAIANSSAAVVNGRVYLAGGQLEDGRALNAMWSISLEDLIAARAAWSQESPWPGRPRFFAPVVACDGSIIIAGGTDLEGDPSTRVFLRDVWVFRPGAGWRSLPDLPWPLQAGLGLCHDGQLFMLGGNDGSLSGQERALGDSHPGFRRDIVQYDPANSRWEQAGMLPASIVTSSVTHWNGVWVVTGGEDRPGHRTNRVVAGKIGIAP